MKKIFLFIGVLLFSCSEDTPTQEVTFTFKNITIDASKKGKTITAKQVLAQIPEASEKNYTLKSISTSDESIAEVSGTKPNFQITLKKVGKFTATIVLEKTGAKDITLNNCTFEITQSVLDSFTFKTLEVNINDTKTISADDILKQITDAQTKGYTLKSITISDENIAEASGTKPNLQITLKKKGNFTATLVLEHKNHFDITLTNCAFEITDKAPAENLTFKTGFQETFVSNGSFTETEILNNVQGTKTGYTIKEIKTLNPTGIVNLAANKKSLSFVKVGSFTATLILEHNRKAAVTITNASFTIAKAAAETLTFKAGFQETFVSGGSFTETEILNNVQGSKTNYTIKEIKNISPTGIVNLAADKKSLSFVKVGSFTATIVLEHDTKADVTIPKAPFTIAKDAAALTFKAGFQERFVSGGSFTETEILNNVQGSKTGYTIKEIKNISPTGIVNLSADKKSLSFIKVGSFTATIVLEHNTKPDVTISNAPFTITNKTAAENLNFKASFQETFVSGGSFTEAEIFNNVQGTKTGYTIKEIKTLSPTGIVNLAANKKSLSFVKVGSFTATLILEHNTKADATITNASFTIAKAAAETLTFKTGGFQERFVSSGSFTETEIFNNVQGSKANYKIKEIKTLSPTGIVNLSSDKKSLSFVKVGSFTATLILEHNTKADATITNARFTITKAAAETLNFKTGFQERFVSGGRFTETEILNNVQGTKTGYTIKEIKTLNPTGIANLAGDKKSLSFVKIGSFTATLVLEHDTKADVTLTKAPFEITKGTAETLTFKANFQETFVSGGRFTETEIFNNVQSSKTGYTIKEIKNINPTGIVNLSSDKKSLSFVKTGSFTATIVLEHNTKADATITNARFTIAKQRAETLTFKAGGFQKRFVSGGSFTETEIFNNVQGSKTNYTIKEIKNINPTGIVNLSSDKKSLSFIKRGNFTATIVLEHPTKADATIVGASFSITLLINKTFGGAQDDVANSIVQTSDGGYAVAGYTASKGRGGKDFWVLKLDSKGDVVWDKTFGGAKSDTANSIIQTKDGGYAVAGEAHNSSVDLWVLKLNSAGTKVWDKTFKKNAAANAHSIIQTSDGGYAIAGHTITYIASSGFIRTDVWVLKLNSTGTKVWDKIFVGAKNKNQAAYSIVQTKDSGYAVAGYTKNKGNGTQDVWVLKLDSTGTKVWDKTFGGAHSDTANSIIQTKDGGYAVAGNTVTKGTITDVWVLKLDSTGTKVWDKTFGGANPDYAYSIIQTKDDGYAVGGSTQSKGNGKQDLWVLKLNSTGTKVWDKTFGGAQSDNVNSIVQTNNGGYVIAGDTQSKGSGGYDFWVLELDADGNN